MTTLRALPPTCSQPIPADERRRRLASIGRSLKRRAAELAAEHPPPISAPAEGLNENEPPTALTEEGSYLHT